MQGQDPAAGLGRAGSTYSLWVGTQDGQAVGSKPVGSP